MSNEWKSWYGIGKPAGLADDAKVLVRLSSEHGTFGPHVASLVEWQKVISYAHVDDSRALGAPLPPAPDGWIAVRCTARPPGLADDARVMLQSIWGGQPVGPICACMVDWSRVAQYCIVTAKATEVEALRTELAEVKASRERIVDELTDQLNGARQELTAARDGLDAVLAPLGAAEGANLSEQIASVREHIGASAAFYARLLAERDDLSTQLNEARAELGAERAGHAGGSNLQRLFLANAEVREARAQREYASVKLDHALLLEQIASAISRGHLPADFHAQLKEWTK